MNPLEKSPLQIFSRRLALTTATAFLLVGVAACKSKQDSQQAQIAQQDDSASVDPATANLAPGTAATPSTGPTRVLGENASYTPQQSADDYGYNDYDADSQYASEPPPPIPEYDQPPPPGPDWYWVPGYWAWGSDGYYWVPGTWVEPPYYGALWTPPYWGYYNDRYLFHRGYWGPHVGFYGGIDYGFGYIGIGYYGGYWRGHDFYYNRAVTNSGNIGYYYDRPVVVNNVHYNGRPQNRVSYNGGRGGIDVRPRPQELAARRDHHQAPVAAQSQLHETAAHDRSFAYNTNHGRPEHPAYARPEAAGINVNRGNQPNRPGENRPGNPAEAQRNAQQQQHNNEAAQRDAQMQQRNAQMQQHNQQQHNAQMQQQNREAQQHNQQMHNNEAAQRNAQMQQHNEQQHNAQVQQQNREAQQHNQQMQQHNNEAAQRAQQMQQRNAQAHDQQQRNNEAAQRAQQMQQRNAQMQQQRQAQQHAAQQRQARPAPQQRAEQPRPAPAPHAEAPRPAPPARAEAPHPAPAPRPEGDHGHH